MKTTVQYAESFLAYCKANPDLRFWQALLNWSRMPFILISGLTAPEVNTMAGARIVVDPYYWKGVNDGAE